MTRIVLVAGDANRRGALATACALGVAAALGRRADGGVAVLDLESTEPPRSGLLASPAARALEARAAELGRLGAAARGHICLLRADPEVDPLLAAEELAADWLIVSCGETRIAELLEEPLLGTAEWAVVIGAGGRPRSLLGLLARELRRSGIRLKVWRRPPGWLASRRARAGLDPGGLVAATSGRHLHQLFGLRLNWEQL